MVLVITFFMLSLFSTFFYLIWLWYLALLPLAIFVFMLLHWVTNVFKNFKFEILREKRSLIFIRILTMIGISGILFFIWIKEISVYLTLLIINIFLRLWSHVFKYEDWKLIFEIWTWLINIIILWNTLLTEWFFTFFKMFSLIACLMLWIYAFLQFIVWIFFPKDEKRTYEIALLWIITLGSTLIKYFYNTDWIIPICLFLLALICIWIYITNKWEIPSKQPNIISVRRILAWERIFKKIKIPQRKISLHERIDNRPIRFSRILEFFNLWLLIYLFVYFFYGIFSSYEITLWLRYWIWITFFLINTFLLKRIDCASNISRFALALIVNFVFYSLLLLGRSNINSVLPILIIWWFVCQIALFFVDRINIKLFSNTDYIYRTIVTFIASICNIILLFHINLPKQFLFSLIFIYIWIELLLLYYIIKFLHEREDAIINADKYEKEAIQKIASSNINDNL